MMNLIDSKDRNRLDDAEKAFFGYKDRLSGKFVGVCQALKHGKVSYDIGTRLMEYQIASGKFFFSFFFD